MSEIIDRAAKAISDAHAPWRWAMLDEKGKGFFRKETLAGIAAICEPTPDMEDAGARILSNAINEPYLTNRELASKIFQAMIGTVLENSK